MGIKTIIRTKNGHRVVELNRRQAIRERCLNCSAWSYAEVGRCIHADAPFHSLQERSGQAECQTRDKGYPGLLCLVHGHGAAKQMCRDGLSTVLLPEIDG